MPIIIIIYDHPTAEEEQELKLQQQQQHIRQAKWGGAGATQMWKLPAFCKHFVLLYNIVVVVQVFT